MPVHLLILKGRGQSSQMLAGISLLLGNRPLRYTQEERCKAQPCPRKVLTKPLQGDRGSAGSECGPLPHTQRCSLPAVVHV